MVYLSGRELLSGMPFVEMVSMRMEVADQSSAALSRLQCFEALKGTLLSIVCVSNPVLLLLELPVNGLLVFSPFAHPSSPFFGHSSLFHRRFQYFDSHRFALLQTVQSSDNGSPTSNIEVQDPGRFPHPANPSFYPPRYGPTCSYFTMMSINA